MHCTARINSRLVANIFFALFVICQFGAILRLAFSFSPNLPNTMNVYSTFSRAAQALCAFALVCSASASTLLAQPALAQPATEAECKAHLQFLASDKLMGRMTGTPGNDEAARYIAEHFRANNVAFAGSMKSYFQPITFVKRRAAANGSLIIAGDTLALDRRFVPSYVHTALLSGNAVYAGFGVVDSAAKRDDYAGLDVKGKIVVIRFGENDSTDVRRGLGASARKREAAEARGVAALVELFTPDNQIMWGNLVAFNKNTRPDLASTETKPHTMNWVIAYDGGKKMTTKLAAEAAQKRPIAVSMSLEPTRYDTLYSNNVIGVIKGTDPVLSQEYVLLSAHYDHIGTGKSATSKDTIYNGARDNGMGTTAILAAAKYFAAKPPKRSVLVLACTAEEVGLLGSRYYATNPAIPHKNVIYNLNIDGAGFNDTTLVTVMGFDRTTAQPLLEEAAKAYGLKAANDPAPEQNLFDRSDNVSFAKVGIPAPTFSPGFTAFDAEIAKYYHQQADEAGEDFNFRYLTRFVNSFITASRLIADANSRPRWKVGDKYEAAFKTLYGEK